MFEVSITLTINAILITYALFIYHPTRSVVPVTSNTIILFVRLKNRKLIVDLRPSFVDVLVVDLPKERREVLCDVQTGLHTVELN